MEDEDEYGDLYEDGIDEIIEKKEDTRGETVED